MSRKQRKQSVGILFTMVMCSFLELLGVALVLPFLEILTDSERKLSFSFVGNAFSIQMDNSIFVIATMFVGVYVIKNSFMIYSSYVQNKFAADFCRDMSISMLSAYMENDYEYFTDVNSSVILRGVETDVDGAYKVLRDLFVIISEIFTVIFLGVFLIVVDWQISVMAAAFALICFWLVTTMLKKPMKKAGINYREANAWKKKTSYQTITAIKEISVLNRRDNFLKEYYTAANEEARTNLTRNFLSSCPDRLLEAFCISSFVIVVCLKLAFSEDTNEFIPVLGSFAMCVFRILPSIAKVSNHMNSIVFYNPSLQECYNNKQEIILKSAHIDENDSEKEVLAERHFEKDLQLKNVSWKYKNTNNYILDNITIKIKKGDVVAFIGHSGAGKTTLADIILGLYKPQSGDVLLDGESIFEKSVQWSSMIGYVPQNITLLDSSIKENVAFGIPSEEIDTDAVVRALTESRIYDYVMSLPNGLNTCVGERGIKLSGGQCQRIAIARALYNNPQILVLDEATSALDNETEKAIMQTINELKRKVTIVIIAHRLSTINQSDVIYEVKDGRVLMRKKEEILGHI